MGKIRDARAHVILVGGRPSGERVVARVTEQPGMETQCGKAMAHGLLSAQRPYDPLRF